MTITALFSGAGCDAISSKSEVYEPLRIVSLNPCSDAILAEIAPTKLVAVSHYSHAQKSSSMPLKTAHNFMATSGAVDEILALEPDVVVASQFLPPATQAALQKLGIRVETIGIAGTIEESADQVRALAAMAGEPAAGDALVKRMQAAIQWSGEDRPVALLWQSGGIVAGGDSLAARMLERAGFANHAALRGLGQGAYLPLEQVLADPPDIIIAAGDERSLAHPALNHLEHVRYVSLDPALLYCGGPTIPRLAARLAEIRAQVP